MARCSSSQGLLSTFPRGSHSPPAHFEQALEHLLGKEIEVAMLDMKPYGFVKASETLARRHRLTRPGTLVWGEVSKVSPAGSRE